MFTIFFGTSVTTPTPTTTRNETLNQLTTTDHDRPPLNLLRSLKRQGQVLAITHGPHL